MIFNEENTPGLKIFLDKTLERALLEFVESDQTKMYFCEILDFIEKVHGPQTGSITVNPHPGIVTFRVRET